MANETIDISIKTEVDAAKKRLDAAKPNLTTQQLTSATRSLERAIELSSKSFNELSNKELKILANSIRKINEIVIKSLTSNVKPSQTTLDLEKKKNASEAKAKSVNDAVRLAKDSGKFITRDGKEEYKLYDSFVKKELKDSGILKANGKQLGYDVYKTLTAKDVDPQKISSTLGGKAEEEKFNLLISRLNDYITTNSSVLKQYTTKVGTSDLTQQDIINQTKEADIKKYEDSRDKDISDDLIGKVKEIDASTATIDKIVANQIEANLSEKEKTESVDDTPKIPQIEAQDASKPFKSQETAVGKAVKQFAVYRIVMGLVKKAVREAISTVKELDKSLTEQAMVTGKTRKQTYSLLKTYQTMAGQLGATSKEVAEVATQFMRQGKTVNESIKLTNAAVSAAKVAGISATDSVNYITTALNGFYLAASDAMEVSDRFAAIAANSATSYEEIAIALSKVASQANLAGMSIDYTTALLAKGLETTREAPETIGTALKTVIARMREMTDYGETLEGDTDLNNVETQLAYVGIALKTTNGELRSTEDVLDDLGRKWDTLSANQQAAVAKALAGTRQQSRLIAMMSDYERVLELQQISLESAGATSAQASVYLEGMEASLNKVSVAWEKLISGITDSEVVIGIINNISYLIDGVAGMMDNWFGMATIIGGIAIATASMLSTKMQELSIAKQQQQVEMINKTIAIDQQKLEVKRQITLLETVKEERKITLQKLQQALATAKENKAKEKDLAKQEEYNKEIRDLEKEIDEQEAEDKKDSAKLAMLKEENKLIDTQGQLLGTVSTSWKSVGEQFGSAIASVIPGLLTLIQQTKAATISQKQYKTSVKESGQEALVAGEKEAGESAAKIPYVGWVIWAILTGAATITAIWTAVNSVINMIDSASDSINNLSDKIYTTNTLLTSLKTAITTFEDLDNQLIKTKEDAESMTETLEKAADSLNEDQKNIYNSFSSNEGKLKYLQQVYKETEEELAKLRKQQLDYINGNKWILNQTGTEAEKVKSAVYAQANNNLYKQTNSIFGKDASSEEATAIKSMFQSVFETMNAQEALLYANSEAKVKSLISSIKDLEIETSVGSKNIAEILTSDDYSIAEKLEAYNKTLENISGSAASAFKKLYSDIDFFNSVSNSAMSYISDNGVTSANLNSIYKSLLKVYDNTEIAQSKFEEFFDYLGNGGTIRDALSNLGLIGDELTKVINSVESALGTTMLDMGQNTDKLTNQIQNLYKKSTEWYSMSETDKSQFLSDNAELFANNDELLRAFENNDFNAIKEALLNSESLQKAIKEQQKAVQDQIEIEKKKIENAIAQGEDADYTYLRYLESLNKKYYDDLDSLVEASYETRLDIQNKQLEAYKSFLQEEKDATVKALEDRKTAYEDYFKAINEAAEDEDYLEEVNKLVSNISKIGASSDAASLKQAADLESQLQDKYDERIKQLRERAQEAITQDIDNKINEINEKFDDLNESNRLILAALTKDIEGGGAELIGEMMLSKYNEGYTDLELVDYYQSLKEAFSGTILGVDWANLNAASNNVTNNDNSSNISINGMTISGATGKELITALINAMRQNGDV